MVKDQAVGKGHPQHRRVDFSIAVRLLIRVVIDNDRILGKIWRRCWIFYMPMDYGVKYRFQICLRTQWPSSDRPVGATLLRRYSKGLLDTLEHDLSGLSGTGVALKVTTGSHFWCRNRRRKPLRTAETVAASRDHRGLKQLNHWLANQSGPFLLLVRLGRASPFCMASFACRLAEDILRWCDNPESQPLPPVPFPVRLREWEWYSKQEFIAERSVISAKRGCHRMPKAF